MRILSEFVNEKTKIITIEIGKDEEVEVKKKEVQVEQIIILQQKMLYKNTKTILEMC